MNLFKKSNIIAVAFLLSFVSSASAHISYSGRDFGVFYGGGPEASVTIASNTVTSNFGWASGTDANLGDSHKLRAFRFTLLNTGVVSLEVQGLNVIEIRHSRQRVGESGILDLQGPRSPPSGAATIAMIVLSARSTTTPPMVLATGRDPSMPWVIGKSAMTTRLTSRTSPHLPMLAMPLMAVMPTMAMPPGSAETVLRMDA